MSKGLYRRIFSFMVLALLALPLYAPPGGSWNPGNTEPTVPLNGGLVFLLVAAVVYGSKKFYSNRKKN